MSKHTYIHILPTCFSGSYLVLWYLPHRDVCVFLPVKTLKPVISARRRSLIKTHTQSNARAAFQRWLPPSGYHMTVQAEGQNSPCVSRCSPFTFDLFFIITLIWAAYAVVLQGVMWHLNLQQGACFIFALAGMARQIISNNPILNFYHNLLTGVRFTALSAV